jgi:hypothetical protein
MPNSGARRQHQEGAVVVEQQRVRVFAVISLLTVLVEGTTTKGELLWTYSASSIFKEIYSFLFLENFSTWTF